MYRVKNIALCYHEPRLSHHSKTPPFTGGVYFAPDYLFRDIANDISRAIPTIRLLRAGFSVGPVTLDRRTRT